jgi:hypothetical protein
VATEEPSNGKGILVTNTDITIDRLEFSGAAVADGNGAGIRYQGGQLTITNSVFRDNQNGLLANPDSGGSITIRGSEFAFNGAGDGYTHNLYVGPIGKLDIVDSYFHDASVGHQIKSRALTTIIRDSRISEGEGGNGAYSVDLPNGGRAVLTGNFIEQGAASGNPAVIAFGVEGNLHAGSSIEMTGNTVVNGLDSPSARLLLNESGTTAEIQGNQVFGLGAGQYGSGSVNVSGMIVLGSKPGSAPSVEVAMPRAAAVEAAFPEPAVQSLEDAAPAAWDEASERPETEFVTEPQDEFSFFPAAEEAVGPAEPRAVADAEAPDPSAEPAEPEVEDWERAMEIATSTPEAWWEDASAQDYEEYGIPEASNEDQDAADAAALEFAADHWSSRADWNEEANHFDDFAFA